MIILIFSGGGVPNGTFFNPLHISPFTRPVATLATWTPFIWNIPWEAVGIRDPASVAVPGCLVVVGAAVFPSNDVGAPVGPLIGHASVWPPVSVVTT